MNNMNGDIYLYCVILCIAFLLCNICHVGLRNKTFCLPSTMFAIMWAITTYGLYLASIPGGLYKDSQLKYTALLEKFGYYQFEILLVCFLAFFLAHYTLRNVTFFSYKKLTANKEIPLFIAKFRWILYLLFAFGMFRLISVVAVVGFDYSAMREYYLVSRINFSGYDNMIIRIGSYIVQLAMLYVAMYGVYSAVYGIDFRRLIINFVLFSPFQLSFGGRLYILSFFVPFLLSYVTVKTINGQSIFKDKRNLKKLVLLIAIPIILTTVAQSLKHDRDSQKVDTEESIQDLFYTSSIYIRINEQWKKIPFEEYRELGLGRNCAPYLFTKSPDYRQMLEGWSQTGNYAFVCVPSMMPEMYLDFGRYGSLFVYFIVFYIVEYIAIKKLTKFSFENLVIYILLCLFAFNTASSAMSTNFKTIIVGLAFMWIFNKMYKRRILARG